MVPLLLPLAALAGGQVVPTPAPPVVPDDIVVTARKGPAAPPREAVDYYRRHCFDAYRLTGEAAPPVADPDWQELDEAESRRFGAADPAAPAFGLRDETRGQTLLLRFETIAHPRGLVEKRCTMVILGGTGHAALPGRMSAVFGGNGARHHVGHPDGTRPIAGWRQWLWTGMPARRSPRWRGINADRSDASARFLVILEPRFYVHHDFIVGDLKTRTDGARPTSVLTFSLIRRGP